MAIPPMSVVYDQLLNKCFQVLLFNKEDYTCLTFEGHSFHKDRAGIKYASRSEKKGYITVPERVKSVYPVDGMLGVHKLCRQYPAATAPAILKLAKQLRDYAKRK